MKFDIVTPSYNQAKYLRETIDSVVSQEGPDVEISYYIMDGGSTDGSPDLIRSYESKLAYWRSAQDEGQSAAIAEGLAMGDGEIVSWINSDDLYPLGAFQKVAEFFISHPEVDAVYGDCLMINEQSTPVGLSNHIPVSWQDLFETPYLINQEATFVRRRIYEKVGGVDSSFWGAMDYDLWLRTFYEGRFYYFPEILGIHRFLPEQKSSTSERYINEMQQAREKFAKHYSLAVPPWPFSKEGRERIKAKWERRWDPILQWIREGCIEGEFTGPVGDMWERYSQNGVLSVRGGTSFGWVGPEAVYVLDRRVVGPIIEWIFGSPFPGLGSGRLLLDIEGRSFNIELQNDVSQELRLREDKRFSVVRIAADRAFIPALENWGPAYFSLSLTSSPRPKGKCILSVQSIPSLPSLEDLKKQKGDKTNIEESLINDSVASSVQTSSALGHSINKRPLRIAFFTSHPAIIGSGSERLIYATVSALIARGHDARVYVMNAHMDRMPPFFARQMPKFPLETLFERVFARMTGWNDILFPSTLLLRTHSWIGSADIWHFHNLHGHYVSIPLLGLMSWTKCVIVSPVDQYLSTGHCPYTMGCERYLIGCGSCTRLDEPWPGISRDGTHALWQMKRLFCRFSKVNVLFHTQALADHYEKTFVRHRPRRVIHYGVNLNCYRQLSRAACARELGVEPSSRFVVGLLHSNLLEPRKGIIPIVKRLGDLAKQFPGEIDLLVVGHGSEAVRDVVPLELSVTALPFLTHAHELANALNLCDVLLYPTQAENLSLTCLNALACGVPVISYDAGGQKEAIKDGVNGFVVDMNDREAMFKALMEMIENPDLCRRLSEGARHTAEVYFDFERYIDELLDYYHEMI